KAMFYAMNRDEMAATIQAGMVPVMHTFFGPGDPEFAQAQQAAVHYDYDPARALQLLQELGYSREADGRLVDSAHQPLTVPIWASSGLDSQTKGMLSTVDYWKQIGIDPQPVVIPPQRIDDREYLATFPAFLLRQQSV